MTVVTVKINDEQDLPALEEFLTDKGMEFEIDDDDWGDLPAAAVEGIKAGLADIEAGRTYSHEYVMAYMDERLKRLKAKNG